jgi:hypothetical protein
VTDIPTVYPADPLGQALDGYQAARYAALDAADTLAAARDTLVDASAVCWLGERIEGKNSDQRSAHLWVLTAGERAAAAAAERAHRAAQARLDVAHARLSVAKLRAAHPPTEAS